MSNIKEDLLVVEVSPKKRVKRAKIKDDGRIVELYQVDEKDYLETYKKDAVWGDEADKMLPY